MSINMNETCVNRVWAQPSESCLRTSWRERLGCLALNPMMRITRSLRKCWTRQRPRRWHAAHLRLIIFIIILCNQTSPLLPPSFLHRTSFCRFLSARLPSSLHHIFFALYQKSRLMWQICFCNLRVFVFEPPLGVSRLQRFHNAVTKGTAMMH